MQQNELHTFLAKPRRLHFIGVGGSGMFPLVQILLAAGHTVQGSDVNEGTILDKERALGVSVMLPQRAENIGNAELVVYSAAISADNPERVQAQALGLPCIERSVMLGYVASLYQRALCIAGTHGKTTTTGMATQILEMAGAQPAAVIGGLLPLINGYGKAGKGDTIVVEACEYHNTFLELRPHTAVLLNVDNDHLEFFGSMQGLQQAFASFCRLATHTVVYNGDDANTLAVVTPLEEEGRWQLVSFGLGQGCQWQAVNLAMYKPGFYSFTVLHNGKPQGEVRLGAPGRHNVYNALAAYVAASLAGASHAACANGLAAFGGTGRRFEVLGVQNGVTIADDYAHHPTEVAAVLSTAASMGFGQVWAVHQPYTYSRTKMLMDEFAQALSIADRVVLTAIMGGREKQADWPDVNANQLAAKLPGSACFETQQQAAAYVLANARPGDLVITLGCGDIYKCAKMMLQ